MEQLHALTMFTPPEQEAIKRTALETPVSTTDVAWIIRYRHPMRSGEVGRIYEKYLSEYLKAE